MNAFTFIVGYIAVMAVVGYFCAATRGRGGVGAFLAVLLGPIGIIIALLLPPTRPRLRAHRFYEYGGRRPRIR